jgi:hypothetical protein
MIFQAKLQRRETCSEADRGVYWLSVLYPNGQVANSGTSFASEADALLFLEGLDMAARLHDSRVLLMEAEAQEDEQDDEEQDARPRCGDCGEPGERTGHMTCQYPQDHG